MQKLISGCIHLELFARLAQAYILPNGIEAA
jgi:hypothetical protein